MSSCKECKRQRQSGCSRWLVKCGSTLKNFILGIFQQGTYVIPFEGEKEGEYLIPVPVKGSYEGNSYCDAVSNVK